MKISIILFFLSFCAFANRPVDILKSRLSTQAVGAHQGGIFRYHPNTMEAFEDARKQGAEIIEIDLRLSADGVPVVYHDEKLQGWTQCRGNISSKALSELKACVFYNSEIAQIPTFEEVLQWSSGRVIINAEFKTSTAILPALTLVKKYRAHSWTYFQAKGSRSMYELAHAFDPQVVLLYVINSTPEDLDWALAQDDELAIIELHDDSRTPGTVSAIHEAGKLASENSWHFSWPQEIFNAGCERAFSLGIDIAITNRPKWCIRQRNQFLKTFPHF